jgi:hypothetical protein
MKAKLEARCVGDESRSVVVFGPGPVEAEPPAVELASSGEVRNGQVEVCQAKHVLILSGPT